MSNWCFREDNWEMRTEKNNKPLYSVPDGYFAGLEQRLSAIPESPCESPRWQGILPYVAIAAAVAIFAISGMMLVNSTAEHSPYQDMSILEEMRMADMVPVTDPSIIYGYTDSESSEYTLEEISAYLVDSGTTLEHIEYYENEK